MSKTYNDSLFAAGMLKYETIFITKTQVRLAFHYANDNVTVWACGKKLVESLGEGGGAGITCHDELTTS